MLRFTVATQAGGYPLRNICVTNNQGYVVLIKTRSVLSSFMTYHRVCNRSTATGDTSGTETDYPFGAPECTPVFSWGRLEQSLVFYVVFCISLIVHFWEGGGIAWSVLYRFTIPLVTPMISSNCSNKVICVLRKHLRYIKGALDFQPQVIKFTSCFPRVGGYLRVLRLPPPLKLVAII